ncbi:putative G-protein coupled receptor 158, partial [Frankliniella fusca]
YNTYTYNSTAHTDRVADEILSVTYEDGKWSKPYYDCGGGNIWMLTYTVPFFGFANGSYFFKGTSGIDIDLRRVDIDQCPSRPGSTELNIFAASDKCKKRTTECVAIKGLGFRRGSYHCVCRKGFYFPDTKATRRAFNGSHIEEEYEKMQLQGQDSEYAVAGAFECLQCAEGCESCEDSRPCVLALNWAVRTALLVLSCAIICCLPAVLLFTWKYQHVKVVRAASPVLLRVIVLGAFFIYCTTIVSYFKPRVFTCTLRLWLRELGFSLTYGALMFKTWRISVIFRVRSAKAVKITDVELLQRVGAVAGLFGVLLAVRTLVDPPPVIVGRTADDLKAFLCRTDWWDHCFTVCKCK